jgi:hypothetical protein
MRDMYNGGTDMAVISGGVRLVVTAQQENTQRITVLHYRGPIGHVWTQPELLALATNFWNGVRTAWKASTGITVNFLSITATDMGDALLPVQAVYNIPQPEPGTAGGDPAPANVACCVSWKTPYANRKLRGRTYLYGLTEGHSSGSVLTSSYLALAAALATLLTTFVNGTGVSVMHVVYSRAANVMTPVTTFLIDSIVDSQRRRLPNRGA